MKRIFLTCVALLSTTLWSTVVPDGTFDQLFGVGGVVTISNLGTRSQCFSLRLNQDNSIITAGSATVGGVNYQALVKLVKDGTQDLTFGDNGAVVNTAIVVPALFINGFEPEIVLYPDGRILVGTSNTTNDLVISRYLKDGSVDTTFGSGLGYVVLNIGTDTFGGIALQKDEKIVVAGTNNATINGFLLRLNTNGSFDTSFGTNGVVLDVLPTLGSVFVTSVQIDVDGKIIIAGNVSTRPFVARFNSNGSLDTTFGTSSGYTLFLGINGSGLKAIIQGDGAILQLGVQSGQVNSFVIRYTHQGLVDASFGQAGLTTFSVAGATLTAFSDITIQADGKLAVCGNARLSNINNFLLVRFNSDGSLDQSFAQSGSFVTPYVANGGILETLAINSDNEIISGGYVFTAPNQTFPNIAVVKTVVDSLQTSALSNVLWQRYYNQNNR